MALKEYFQQQYFEACNLMLGELDDRFDQPSLSLAVYGVAYEKPLKFLEKSLYGNDLDFWKLKYHLGLIPDAIKVANSSIKKVTEIRTICNATNTQKVFKTMLSEMHKLLRTYLTIPITTAICERTDNLDMTLVAKDFICNEER